MVLRISEDTILVGVEGVVYCDIGLTGVTRGRDVTVEVTWSQDGVLVTENSKVTTSGVTSDVGHLHSSLSFTPVHFSDMATYECRVTLTPILGPPTSPVTSSTSIYLNISGLIASKFSSGKLSSTHSEPVDPVAPEDIVFREVESESVVIQWTVAYISYSPETYVVQYGTSRETLVHNSSRRASEVGTTTYSVPLSGLRDNTTYYVQVLATNTALRSSRSSVESFTILTSAGVRYEYLLSVCLCTATCVSCVSNLHY